MSDPAASDVGDIFYLIRTLSLTRCDLIMPVASNLRDTFLPEPPLSIDLLRRKNICPGLP